MIKKIEAWLLLITREQGSILAICTLGLFVTPLRTLFLFMLVINLLPKQITTAKIQLYHLLPFRRSELFLFNWLLIIFIATTTALLSSSYTGFELSLTASINKSIIFASAYFSIALISATLGRSHLTTPLFILFADFLLTQSYVPEVLQLISPIKQGSRPLAALIAALLLLMAWKTFLKGEQS